MIRRIKRCLGNDCMRNWITKLRIRNLRRQKWLFYIYEFGQLAGVFAEDTGATAYDTDKINENGSRLL